MSTSASKLSAQQRQILLYLYECHGAVGDHPLARRLRVWGTRWKAQKWESRSRHASMSRALSRLESRGLLLRQNEVSGAPKTRGIRANASEPHVRTTSVLLLLPGIEIAKQLTKRPSAEC